MAGADPPGETVGMDARTPSRPAGDVTTIVGWDGSLAADLALEWAAGRAAAEHEGMLILRAGKGQRSELDELAQSMRDAHPGLQVRAEQAEGDPIDQLLRYSGPNTLVVAGTTPRRGARLRYHWSVGSRLAARAIGAAAIVPGLVDDAHTGVVAGIDESDVALRAARFAAREARRLGHELVLVHAWHEPEMTVPDLSMDRSLLEAVERSHRNLLDTVTDSLARSNPDLAVRAELVQDHAAHALKRATATAALLVLGTERLHRIDAMLGSVAQAVILDIQIPTVVVAPGYVV